ncbi:glycosyltransferase family 2 protein [Protaetiibacter larvae]|uniref:Glycosyltransferase n=1 Tax=Protaetiibacter larvae TaxID=2592654 RepID=A0A5C1Y7F6_9MICO|nr:glycosyltransferase family 2 protein [Protaetiibacter larvae]QEO09580.1 glycosyltransferase [Protaetiibacter larvae]
MSPSRFAPLARLTLIALSVVVPLVAATLVVSTFPADAPVALAGAVFAFASVPVWASGIHQLVLLFAASRVRSGEPPVAPVVVPRTAIVMCTADDFAAERARACAAQDVPVELVILDDSRTAEGRARVDRFVREHPARVIRRAERRGFKAGNLSNALEVLADEFPFWVLVDADQALAPDAVRRLHARRTPGVAVVQGRPVPRVAGSPFAALLGALPGTHLATSQSGRPAPWFLGRVALLDVAAVRAVGGVPRRVVEDVALTVELRAAGYRIVDAPEVLGEEDAPVDYPAFRVQQLKYLEGAFELVVRSGWRILRAPFPLAERLEILIAHLLVPAAVLGGGVAVIAGGVLAGARAFPVGAGVLAALAGLAPVAGELVRLLRAGRIARALAVALLVPAVYASLLVACLCALLRLLGGRAARFRVTPKHAVRRGAAMRLRVLLPELAVTGVALAGAAASGVGAFLPGVLLPVATAVALGVVPLRGRPTQRAVAAISPRASRISRLSPALVSAASRTMRPSAPRTTA